MADAYYFATRKYWRTVLAVRDELWAKDREIVLKGNSDQTGAFAALFDLAEQSAGGRFTPESARPAIRAALDAQMPGG